MGLLDEIDRLAAATAKIRVACEDKSEEAGRFTRTLLQVKDQVTIRDMLPGEIGLFTIAKETGTRDSTRPGAVAVDEVARKEVVNATPLRHGQRGVQDPEILLGAALKLLDIYETLPKYRELVLQELERVRTVQKKIAAEERSSEDVQPPAPNVTILQQQHQAEEALRALQSRFKALREKRDALRAKVNEKRLTQSESNTSELSLDETSPSTRLSKREPPRKPAAKPTLKKPGLFRKRSPQEKGKESSQSPSLGTERRAVEPPKPTHPSLPPTKEDRSGRTFFEDESEEIDDDDDDDGTDVTFVIPQKDSPISQSTSLATPIAPDVTPRHIPEQFQAPPIVETPAPQKQSHGKNKLMASTELNKIISKLWLTMGETISPGHNYAVGNGKGTERVPGAKETISILQAITDMMAPTPVSPVSSSAISSLLSDPSATPPATTPHQILTAYLLHALLTSSLPLPASQTCPIDAYAAPLIATKQYLAEKGLAKGWPNSAELGLRVVYGCIAKKLLKIERGGGEQILKFVE